MKKHFIYFLIIGFNLFPTALLSSRLTLPSLKCAFKFFNSIKCLFARINPFKRAVKSSVFTCEDSVFLGVSFDFSVVF